MSRFIHFKVAFTAAAMGITAYQLILGLFDMDWNVDNALWKLLGKSIFIGITSALILGLINACFKFFPTKIFKNPTNEA